MTRYGLLATLLAAAALAGAADPPADRGNVDAALKLTQAAAAEYAIRAGADKEPLKLQATPVLRWSNPEAGEVHGNVFVWTRDDRPLVAASLFKWFSPRDTMEHEFQSLAEEGLAAEFHGAGVWKTSDAGLTFADIPKAPVPAGADAPRLLQMKQLAKEFTATGRFGTSTTEAELRLLPQPVHRYAPAKGNVLSGGLFAFVRATDPEIWLLIEARGKGSEAKWQYAAARMHSWADLKLKHRDEQVWAVKPMVLKDVFDRHELPYTAFRFKEVPDFLKDAVKPKP